MTAWPDWCTGGLLPSDSLLEALGVTGMTAAARGRDERGPALWLAWSTADDDSIDKLSAAQVALEADGWPAFWATSVAGTDILEVRPLHERAADPDLLMAQAHRLAEQVRALLERNADLTEQLFAAVRPGRGAER